MHLILGMKNPIELSVTIGALARGEHRDRSPRPETGKFVLENDIISEGSI